MRRPVNKVAASVTSETVGMAVATAIAMTVAHVVRAQISVSHLIKTNVRIPLPSQIKANLMAIHVHHAKKKGKVRKAIAAAAGKNGATASKNGKTAAAASKPVTPREQTPQQEVTPKVPMRHRPWSPLVHRSPQRASLNLPPKATASSANAPVHLHSLLRTPSSAPN